MNSVFPTAGMPAIEHAIRCALAEAKGSHDSTTIEELTRKHLIQ